MPKNTTSSVQMTLKNHPRMIGVLFTLILLLSQAGSAAAANGVTIDCYPALGC